MLMTQHGYNQHLQAWKNCGPSLGISIEQGHYFSNPLSHLWPTAIFFGMWELVNSSLQPRRPLYFENLINDNEGLRNPDSYPRGVIACPKTDSQTTAIMFEQVEPLGSLVANPPSHV